MTDRDSLERFIKTVTPGVKRACLKMTDEWQFPGKATFDANGAWAARRIGLAERESQRDGKDGKRWRVAYRLTPAGLTFREHLEQEPRHDWPRAGDHHKAVDVMHARAVAAEQESAALRAALAKYGRHYPLCAAVGGYGYCDCGLEEARSTFDRDDGGSALDDRQREKASPAQ